MRSVRLDPELDEQVRRAAAAENSSVSEFVRRALAERAERTLSGQVPTAQQLADFIGIVHGGGGRARRTGDAFSDMIAERHGRG